MRTLLLEEALPVGITPLLGVENNLYKKLWVSCLRTDGVILGICDRLSKTDWKLSNGSLMESEGGREGLTFSSPASRWAALVFLRSISDGTGSVARGGGSGRGGVLDGMPASDTEFDSLWIVFPALGAITHSTQRSLGFVWESRKEMGVPEEKTAALSKIDDKEDGGRRDTKKPQKGPS